MPGDFLQQMADASARRATAAEAQTPLDTMRGMALDTPPPVAPTWSAFDLIAEVKRTSPSQGRLAGEQLDVVAQARAYANAGAALISVLTEPDRFGGSSEDLRQIASRIDTPAMRKDFLVEPYQVFEARAWGASAVLLIARILDDDRLSVMLDACEAMGLIALLEAFDRADVDRSARAITNRTNVLLGLNCRNLATLEEDVSRFESLSACFPAGSIKIAESGIATPQDAAAVARLGYDGALVGTALMRSDNPAALAAGMLEAGRKARA